MCGCMYGEVFDALSFEGPACLLIESIRIKLCLVLKSKGSPKSKIKIKIKIKSNQIKNSIDQRFII